MTSLRPILYALALAVAGVHAVEPAPPLPPPGDSPVALFRKLLASSPAERGAAITNRAARHQAIIRRRLAAYEAMSPGQREERLLATELYWYLAPLLRQPADDRAAALARVPANWRATVTARLAVWDTLPADDRTELLRHEEALHYFARIRAETLPPLPGAQLVPAPPVPAGVERELALFRELPVGQQRRIKTRWNELFDPAAAGPAATRLSAEETAAMQAALERFRALSPEQRRTCVEAFARFASMSAMERNEFLRSAELWSRLTPVERERWRNLVTRLPPLPPGLLQAPLPPLPEVPERLDTAATP